MSARYSRGRIRWVIAAGAALLFVALLVYLDRDSGSRHGIPVPAGVVTRPDLVLPSDDATASPAEGFATEFGGVDVSTPPFAVSDVPRGDFGSGVYDIEFRVDSDAAVGAVGYWTRGGGGDTVFSEQTSLTLRRQAQGIRPAAQLGVQVTGNGTQITCAIYVNGQRIVSHTVYGRYQVAICTA